MQISDVSECFNISIYTLRYYEKIGLIPPVHRNRSGIRDYTKGDLDWVSFILNMRDSGMSIESLIKYVNLCEGGDRTGEVRKRLLLTQRDKIKEKIEFHQTALDKLNEKIAHYDNPVSTTGHWPLGIEERRTETA